MRIRLLTIAVALLVGTVGGCEAKKNEPTSVQTPAPPTTPPAPAPATIDRVLLNAFAVVNNATGAATPEQIALGKSLYYETRLSKNHDLSCNSCHDLAKYGVDGQVTSTGHKGQKGGRNAPTVYNAAGHFAQFWDAREKTIEDQALKPIQNPVEMAIKDEAQIVGILKSIPGYVTAFNKAYGNDSLTAPNVAKAIGAFERTLVTSGRWDKYLAGDDAALSEPEKLGLAKFLNVGCQTCHAGANMGGAELKKLGLAKPWTGNPEDTGRMMVTKAEVDRLLFKVPSLRNVAKTAPYFHDGSVATLNDAVKLMARHQLGKQLGDADVNAIVTFLAALTGDLPSPAAIAKPELPPSGPRTPKPDPK